MSSRECYSIKDGKIGSVWAGPSSLGFAWERICEVFASHFDCDPDDVDCSDDEDGPYRDGITVRGHLVGFTSGRA